MKYEGRLALVESERRMALVKSERRLALLLITHKSTQSANPIKC